MIKPTIGRVVWYRPSGNERIDFATFPTFENGEDPYTALITRVHDDVCVNLSVFDSNGVVFGMTFVHLKQSPDELPIKPYCEWMPYQVGQAKARQEQLGGEALTGQMDLPKQLALQPARITLIAQNELYRTYEIRVPSPVAAIVTGAKVQADPTPVPPQLVSESDREYHARLTRAGLVYDSFTDTWKAE